jgi:hypothetical protein
MIEQPSDFAALAAPEVVVHDEISAHVADTVVHAGSTALGQMSAPAADSSAGSIAVLADLLADNSFAGLIGILESVPAGNFVAGPTVVAALVYLLAEYSSAD